MNKTVFITGATSGIGLGCAHKFAANGDRLILNGRNVKKLEAIRQELQAAGTKVIVLAFDVRDREAARKSIERFFGKSIYLEVFVKVDKDWRNSTKELKNFGYDLSD